MAATVKQRIEYNLRSMEIFYLPVRNIQLGITHSYLTQLRINDPKVGVLVDKTFMPVAERTVISEKITSWLISNLFADIQKFRAREVESEWFGLYIPIRVLTKQNFISEIQQQAESNNISLKDICLCFNQKILYEDHNKIMEILSQTKEAGMKSLIMDFGDDFCPVTRISSIKTDYVLLSESVAESLNSTKQEKRNAALALYQLLNALDVEAISSSISDDETAGSLPESSVLCTGKLAGSYRKPRSVR
ncbi:MAG: EAL domain-containing protein [Clostridia bacterium]|jgi:EAL domain-containing protein (putative c-di-GMP-specific phosphodiesterase class I)